MTILHRAKEIRYLTSAVETLIAQIKDTYVPDDLKDDLKETAKLILEEIKKEIK